MANDLYEVIKREEGFSRYAYRCPAGHTTIGYGRNIDKAGGHGITTGEGALLLMNDVRESERDLALLFDDAWSKIGRVRQNALIEMRFNLGPSRFRGFERMIHAIERLSWPVASREAVDSAWATQLPRRAYRIAEELRTGVAQ